MRRRLLVIIPATLLVLTGCSSDPEAPGGDSSAVAEPTPSASDGGTAPADPGTDPNSPFVVAASAVATRSRDQVTQLHVMGVATLGEGGLPEAEIPGLAKAITRELSAQIECCDGDDPAGEVPGGDVGRLVDRLPVAVAGAGRLGARAGEPMAEAWFDRLGKTDKVWKSALADLSELSGEDLFADLAPLLVAGVVVSIDLTVLSWVIALIVAYYAALFAVSWFRRPPPQSQGLPLMVVLVPARNEELVLETTLAALTELSYAGEHRVLVIDDASTDATAAICETWVARDPTDPGQPPGAPRGRAGQERGPQPRLRVGGRLVGAGGSLARGARAGRRGAGDRRCRWATPRRCAGPGRALLRRPGGGIGPDRGPDRERPGQRPGPDAGHRVRRVQLAGADRPGLVRVLGPGRQRPVHPTLRTDAAAGRPLASRGTDRGPRPRAPTRPRRVAHPVLPPDLRRATRPAMPGGPCCANAPAGSRATTSAGATCPASREPTGSRWPPAPT